MRGPTLERERALWAQGCRYVAGLDEVGRGPLAGPVVAAAVVLPPGQPPIDDVDDCKVMTAAARARVAGDIKSVALAWAVAAASVREIDRINIRRASALAMRRALFRLGLHPDHILLDGPPLPELAYRHEAVIDGDARCQSIAAASVLAKVVRDRLMERLARHYPTFGWDHNKGYATPDHLAALDAGGMTPHHRVTFEPVGQLKLL